VAYRFILPIGIALAMVASERSVPSPNTEALQSANGSPATRRRTEEPPMVQGLGTVIHQVSDLARAKAWYTQAFQLEPYFDQPFYVGFNIGGYELGLDPDADGPKPGPGGSVAYWRVQSVTAALQHFVATGARLVAPAKDVGGGVKVATVADPFGNLIGLIENPTFLRSDLAAQRGSDQPQGPRETVTAIVAKIQRADYEGDRPALKRLHAELAPFADDRQVGSRALYWRGFALWRRALNGFNEAADRREIGEDLEQAVVDFRSAVTRDPAFVDAKVGAASCLVNHSFLNLKTDPARARDSFAESTAILDEALAAAPENPRLLWVQGANQWYAPAASGGGQGVALATYQKGLELVRRQKGRVADPLEPAWGEAELLMNLAVANLNRTTPDLVAAEQYAQSALALVPYWHYVRDILLPQIRK
jgi:predicted enzyme related to lactoylglutathione lyase